MTDREAFSPTLCHRGRFFRSLSDESPGFCRQSVSFWGGGGVWRRGDEGERCVNTFQCLKRGCQAGGLSRSLKVAVGEEDGKTEIGVTRKKKRLKIRVYNTRRRANMQTSAAFMWIPVPLRWQPFFHTSLMDCLCMHILCFMDLTAGRADVSWYGVCNDWRRHFMDF